MKAESNSSYPGEYKKILGMRDWQMSGLLRVLLEVLLRVQHLGERRTAWGRMSSILWMVAKSCTKKPGNELIPL